MLRMASHKCASSVRRMDGAAETAGSWKDRAINLRHSRRTLGVEDRPRAAAM